MTHLRRLWHGPRWGGRVLAAIAVVVSLVAASAIVLASSSPPPLSARGTPLPLPSTPPPTAPASTPAPRTAAPAARPATPTTLASVGTNQLIALDSTGAAVSSQGGAWVPIPMPSGASGLVVDRGDADVLVAGGATVRTTSDRGKHWVQTPAQPAATGPFVPLLVSPWNARVLFVSHQGQVAVSTDGGSTWHNVGVPAGGQPVMASGSTTGTFFVGTGGNAYQLTGDGAQVNHRPPMPAGATVTSLAAGQSSLVACCAGSHLLTLNGTKWTAAPITAAGPFAVDGADIWAAVPAIPATAGQTVEESSDGGVTWQARPGLPPGRAVLSLAFSGDGHTVFALTNAGEVYEAQKGVWYLLSTGLPLASPPP